MWGQGGRQMGPGCPEHKKIPDVVQNIATEILRFLSKKYKGGKIDFFLETVQFFNHEVH